VNLEPLAGLPRRPKRDLPPRWPCRSFAPVCREPLSLVRIKPVPRWPHYRSTQRPVTGWQRAAAAGLLIPQSGCLGGSCGACEIEVNGRVVRACISSVPPARSRCPGGVSAPAIPTGGEAAVAGSG